MEKAPYLFPRILFFYIDVIDNIFYLSFWPVMNVVPCMEIDFQTSKSLREWTLWGNPGRSSARTCTYSSFTTRGRISIPPLPREQNLIMVDTWWWGVFLIINEKGPHDGHIDVKICSSIKAIKCAYINRRQLQFVIRMNRICIRWVSLDLEILLLIIRAIFPWLGESSRSYTISSW